MFASLEHRAAAEALGSVTAQCASLEARLQEQGAVLDKTKEEAESAQRRLQACETEVRSASTDAASCPGLMIVHQPTVHSVQEILFAQVRRLSEAHAPCTGALAEAEQELRALQQTCQQLTQDRMQAVANIRKAEAEVLSLAHHPQ